MSNQAPNWFTTQYDNRVTHVYQAKGNTLRPTVTLATRVEAAKATFWVAGKGAARKKLRGQRAVPMNTERKKLEVDLSTWEAFDTCEEYDLDRMNVNEKEVLVETGAKALGRATDLEILGVIGAAAPTSGAGYVADGTPAAFKLEHALAMCQQMQKRIKVWDGQVYCPLPSLFWNQFISYKQVNSSDHVGGNLPFTGATDTRFWNGVNWFLFDDDAFPVPGSNLMDVFMWHKSAVGWGNNTDLRSIWDWDNYESFWTINMQAKGCALVLQSEGLVRFRGASNSAITIN